MHIAYLRDDECSVSELLPALRPDKLPLYRLPQGVGLHGGHRALCHQRLLCLPSLLGDPPPPVCWDQGKVNDNEVYVSDIAIRYRLWPSSSAPRASPSWPTWTGSTTRRLSSLSSWHLLQVL